MVIEAEEAKTCGFERSVACMVVCKGTSDRMTWGEVWASGSACGVSFGGWSVNT